MAWTTTDLLSTIKNRQMIPDASSGSLSSAVLLQFATEELHLTLLPMILKLREKYYLTSFDTSYTSSTTSITIPARSIGGTVSSVHFIVGSNMRPLNPMDQVQMATVQATAQPTEFYFQNNSVVFYPPPTGDISGTVRIFYFQRPNRLAATSDCAQITAINTVTKTVTVNAIPTTWTTSNIFDLIPQTASQSTPYAIDQAITALSGSDITFSATLPTSLTVGDWISLAEYTPIPEIPFEFQPLLAQATVCRALGAINDAQGLANAKADLNAFMTGAVGLITPRDEEGSKKVVSPWRSF